MRIKIRIATAALICVAVAISFSSLVRAKQTGPSQEAQASAEPAQSVWDGVYTQEQASRGEALYAQKCARCHAADLTGGEIAPALNSGEFKSNWSGLSVDDLFERIKVSMPQDKPGSLSRQQTADVAAFVLSKNRFPAGEKELAREAEVLKMIRFEQNRPEVAALQPQARADKECELRLLDAPKPVYPSEGADKGEVLKSPVVAELVVNNDGTVKSVQLKQSCGIKKYDKAVIQALAKWRYNTAGEGCDERASTITVTVSPKD